MRIKLIITSILFLLLAVLASQNTTEAKLNVLFWNFQLPLIVMIVLVFILGLVVGIIVGSLYEKRKSKEEEPPGKIGM